MRTVLYTCPYVPAEWIAAHGLRPSRILPRSTEGAGPVGTRFGVCPYARAFVNEALACEDADAIVLTTVCDQMRRAPDLVRHHTDRPVFLMNVPSTWDTIGAQRLYQDEVRRLGRFLERIGGRAPSEPSLAEVMLDHDATRAAIRDARPYLSARRRAETMAAFYRNGHVELDDLHAALLPGGVPVALVGGPMLTDDFALFDLVEACGASVVLDATESGERTWPAPFDRRRVRDDPLGVLTDAYFGHIPDAFRRPNQGFYQWLGRELADRDVRGVICRRYVWCDVWHGEVGRLREWAPVPVLDIDVDDDVTATRTRTTTRVQAFLEVLV